MLLETVYENAKKIYPMELIAGGTGIKGDMAWFHILEDKRLSAFIKGNELVFTTGIVAKGANWLLDFITELHHYKACGFVVNTGPYINSIPPEAIDLCNRYALPLFTVPWSVKLVDITRYLSRLIFDSERSLFQAATAFKTAILAPEAGEYLSQLSEAGYRQNADYCVVKIGVEEDFPFLNEALKYLQNALILHGDHGIAFSLEGNIIIVFSGSKFSETLAAARAAFLELTNEYPKWRFFMGIGENQKGLNRLEQSYEKAAWAQKAAESRRQPFLAYEDTGIYQIIFPLLKSGTARDYLNRVLGEMLRYDKNHKTDYLLWLKTYIENDGSVQKIAEIMFCHRNTVNYKLKRIRELFSLDTASYEKIAEISAALGVLDLLKDLK